LNEMHAAKLRVDRQPTLWAAAILGHHAVAVDAPTHRS
jgi:hypothetical protein